MKYRNKISIQINKKVNIKKYNVFKRKLIIYKLIPMPVLYGVFLYMGVTSLSGVQVGFLTTNNTQSISIN